MITNQIVCKLLYVYIYAISLDSSEPTGEPQPKKKRFSVIDVSRLKARYLNHLSTDNTDWPKQYVRLALVRMNQPVTRADKDLEETTKLTLAGQIDELLFKKEPLDDLEGIFYYQNKPCPRLILIVGGPGEYCNYMYY